MKAHERHDRRDWLIIFILILLGFLCILLTSGWALRFAPNWRLDTSMESRLDPNVDFLNSRPNGFFEPLDPSILTQPAWINVFLTPGASFATKTPAPALTSVNTVVSTVVPVTPTVKPPSTPIPTNTPVFFPSPTKTSAYVPPSTATSTPGPAISANLGITKTDGVTTYIAGNPVTYTIVVSNSGPGNVTGAVVSDTKPSQVTTWNWTCTQTGGATGCTAMSGNANFTNTVNLPSGASITYTVNANIAVNATGNLVNTATVGMPMPPGYTDPNTANNTATDTDTYTPSADLVITKTDGTGTYTVGGNVTYTITVSNPSGPDNVINATVTDNFPAQITSATWTCTPSGVGASCTPNGTGNINDGTVDLPVGTSVTYTVNATISPAATGNLINTAIVTSSITELVPGNNTATDTDTPVLNVDLGITKSDGVATYIPGTSVTYIINVTNAGPANAIGATVTDVFPASVSATWTCAAAGGATCTAGGSGNINDTVNIPVGGSLTYIVNANIASSATGPLSNTATVTATGDSNLGNNTATDTDTPVFVLDLGITKDDGYGGYARGGSTTYTIVVSNAGPSDVIGAVVGDLIPTQIASWSWACTTVTNASGCDPAPANASDFTDTVNIQSGGSITYTVTANISSSATGNLSNTATVTAPSGYTGTTNDSATDIDTLLIGSTPDGNVYNLPAGGTLTLNITVVADGDAGPDLVYYEFPNGAGILLDWIIVEVSSDGLTWYTVFNWGDNNPDLNTNVGLYIQSNPQIPQEPDERFIPNAALYGMSLQTGIAIDIDAIVPPGTYSYIRFTAPMGDVDGKTEIDGVEVP